MSIHANNIVIINTPVYKEIEEKPINLSKEDEKKNLLKHKTIREKTINDK